MKVWTLSLAGLTVAAALALSACKTSEAKTAAAAPPAPEVSVAEIVAFMRDWQPSEAGGWRAPTREGLARIFASAGILVCDRDRDGISAAGVAGRECNVEFYQRPGAGAI